jgi:hypothetical protein
MDRSLDVRGIAFLILLALGILALVAGVFRTRQHWRAGLPPYGRGTRSLELLLHPERFARAEVVGSIRILNAIGGLLLLGAVGMLVLELLPR